MLLKTEYEKFINIVLRLAVLCLIILLGALCFCSSFDVDIML